MRFWTASLMAISFLMGAANASATDREIAQATTTSPNQDSSPDDGNTKSVIIELNKLETVSGSCRSYFIVRNRLAEPISELQLEVFAFNPDQTIRGQFSLVFPDIRANRNKVVIFDFDDIACSEIDNFLVNDIVSCKNAQGGEIAECRRGLLAQSKTGTALEY